MVNEATGQKKRILIVDDEEHFVMMLGTRLRAQGYEIDEAFTGRQALEKLMKKACDLLILDYLLPDILSPQICRNVREDADLQKLPIIIITGFTGRGKDSFKRDGATDILFKPFDGDELLAKVTVCLEH